MEPAQKSGYAVASLILALVGAFTLVGTLAAIICGAMALGQIRRSPQEIGGKRFAQVGILLGIVFSLITLVCLSTTEFLRLDGLLRSIEWAGKIEYLRDALVPINQSDGMDLGRSASIKLPSPSWGRCTFKEFDAPKEKTDDLVLVNLWDDAYLVCLNKWIEPGQTLEVCRQEGQERFLQSELVNKILGRSSVNSPPPTGHDRDRKQIPGTDTQEFLFDMRLGGMDWTFIIRVFRDGTRLDIVAGGTRKNRLARLQPEIMKALDSYKMEK